MSSLSWWNWNLEMLVVVKGGKPRTLEKNPWSNNKQQTQPTYMYGTGPKLNRGHNGRRRMLSPLHHPCLSFLIAPSGAKWATLHPFSADIKEMDSYCIYILDKLSHLIAWLCLTRIGNYWIHELDWLKSIFTTASFRFSHLDWLHFTVMKLQIKKQNNEHFF